MLDFYWDEWNLAHIREHAVSQDEAQEVVMGASRPFPRAIGRKKFLVHGQTRKGRYLQVIYVERATETVDIDLLDPSVRLNLDDVEEFNYVIHSRDLTPGEKRSARRR